MVIVFSLEPARFEFYTAEDVAPGTRTKPRSSSVSFRRSAATSGGAGTKAAARATTKTTIAVLMTKFQKASFFLAGFRACAANILAVFSAGQLLVGLAALVARGRSRFEYLCANGAGLRTSESGQPRASRILHDSGAIDAPIGTIEPSNEP